MAVANAMGSNVFNVLIGLGLPYFVVQATRGRPAVVRIAVWTVCLAAVQLSPACTATQHAVAACTSRCGDKLPADPSSFFVGLFIC